MYFSAKGESRTSEGWSYRENEAWGSAGIECHLAEAMPE